MYLFCICTVPEPYQGCTCSDILRSKVLLHEESILKYLKFYIHKWRLCPNNYYFYYFTFKVLNLI